MVEVVQIHQLTNCLRVDMQNILMASSSSPKLQTIKAGNQFNGYVSNFTHNQNI